MNRIKSDQNQDGSLKILTKWIKSVEKSYHRIFQDLTPDVPGGHLQTNWTEERFKHIINLKEEALNKGRDMWADYVWVIQGF